MEITKPSITRLARRAGVKSVADDCYETVRTIVNDQLSDILSAALIVNSEHNTKTLMTDDIYQAFRLCGYNVAQSHDMSSQTCKK